MDTQFEYPLFMELITCVSVSEKFQLDCCGVCIAISMRNALAKNVTQ